MGGFWVVHRSLFARLRKIDGPGTALSLILLLVVALVPAAAALVSEHGPAKGMSVYFLLTLSIATVHTLLWAYASFLGDLVDSAIPRRVRLAKTNRSGYQRGRHECVSINEDPLYDFASLMRRRLGPTPSAAATRTYRE